MAAYRRDNVVGTQNMLTAAQSAGVGRFAMIGATKCLLGGAPIENADESWPLEPRRTAWIAGSILDTAWAILRRPGQPPVSRLIGRPQPWSIPGHRPQSEELSDTRPSSAATTLHGHLAATACS
ncbi:MAG: hypothetical protein H0T54_06860 [Geodermatophilaceae bacterium]|nr:hypothetical protein [Geodermatophilaceae bacterium]